LKTLKDPSVIMLVAALVLGAVTRLIGLLGQSIHVDEAHTFLLSSLPWRDMIAALVANDYHPPLFYAITHALLGLGLQHEAYRFFTAPLALITITATWAIARRLFGPAEAGIAAIVIAIDPTAILWDRIYRMYVVLEAVVAVSWWLLIEAENATGRRRAVLWTAFVVCAVVQPYLHYLGIINVFCQALYALPRLRTTWPALASAAASALAFLPWLPNALKQLPGGGLVAGTASLPIEWWTIVRDAVLEGAPLAWIQAPAFDIVVTILAVAMSVWAAWSARRSILPFWLTFAVLEVVLTLVSGKFIAAPRYLLPVLPVFAIGVGQVVNRHLLLPKLRVAAFAVGGAILALFAFCTTNVLFDPRYQFADWNIVSAILAQRAQAGDTIVFDQGYSAEALAKETVLRGYASWPVNAPLDVTRAHTWLEQQSSHRVWYIENQFYYVDPDRRVISYLESTRPQLSEWLEPRVELSNRVYVVLFAPERRPSPSPRHKP
jgi:4-amino-4-deoxy-L-arabinose transferase-like glycosyltransferase